MNREQLAHVLRAAAIVSDGDILVVGSQSILGTADAHHLPVDVTLSIEADLAFLMIPTSRSQMPLTAPLVKGRSSMLSTATTPKACRSRRLSYRPVGETD